jgi:hypothetical protein
MNILKIKSSKAVALALVAVLQVYLSGGFALAAPKAAEPAAKPAARQEIQGRLTTAGDNPVTVNGNSAKTGETIFSGQQIQTPAGTGATVQLGALGSLEIAPGSNVTLTFAAGRIDVVVISGCVTLRATDGTTGTVQSRGNTETTGADGGTIDTCDDAAPGGVPVGGAGTGGVGAGTAGGAAGAGGLGTGAALGLTAAVVGAFTLIGNRLISDSDNPEPVPCTPIPGTTSPLTPPSGCTP